MAAAIARRCSTPGAAPAAFSCEPRRPAASEPLSGIDVSGEAIETARRRVPGAQLSVGPLVDLPYGDASFGVAVSNDVLQHVREQEIAASLEELRRVLRPEGVLAVRTNGGRTGRRERDDWRLYDARSLRGDLELAGFSVERLTYANALLSAVGAARGRSPRAPTASGSGLPSAPGKAASVVGAATLALEKRVARLRRARSLGTHAVRVGSSPMNDVGAFFDAEAGRYDDAYDDPGRGGQILRARLVDAVALLGDGPGDVLDVGMGAGRLCAELVGRDWTVWGVDHLSRHGGSGAATPAGDRRPIARGVDHPPAVPR